MKKKTIKIRKTWAINPVTKIKKSNKIYSRKKKDKDSEARSAWVAGITDPYD